MLQREIGSHFIFVFVCMAIRILNIFSYAEAWHVVMSTDPLVDSDDEDEYAREDYSEFYVNFAS